MSYFIQEIPKDIDEAPPQNFKWTFRMKTIAVICAFLAYLLLLFSAKFVYAKHQRLDKMDELVLKTEDVMHNLHTIDRNLAIQVERIENMVYDEDYDVTTEY